MFRCFFFFFFFNDTATTEIYTLSLHDALPILVPLQIAVNDGLGPNTVNTNPGAFLNLASVSVANNPMVGGTSQQGTALANFANVTGVPFNSMVTNWSSSNTNVATVTANGFITATGQGTASISATALGSTTSVTITALAVQPTISQ